MKIKVPQGLVSGMGSLPGLQMAAFVLCPHMAFSVGDEGGGSGVSSSYKDTSLNQISHPGPTLMTSFIHSYLLKCPISIYSHIGG